MRQFVVRLLAFTSLIICATASPLAAQAGTVRGTIADSSGVPLPSATISIEGTFLRATSGNQGDYEITGVPVGSHTVRVRLIGYQPVRASVTVAAGEVVRQDFTLARSVIQLAPVDVVVGSR